MPETAGQGRHAGRPFRHNEQSFAIARRLNLTAEVCDGILTHTGEREPATLEGKIVRIVDRVAYINHDIDDAMRFGILGEGDLPRAEIDLLGPTGATRIDTLVHDLIETSEREGDIRQSDKGQYHCFGCGVGGDAISFVRETEGLDFVEAIEWLADRFRVPLEYEESSAHADAQRRGRERLQALLEQAAAFYERMLWDSKLGEPARAYLESRSFGEEVCREFRLGLSPLGATLVAKAREKGFTQTELQSAGLVSRRGSDYFQGRLMFPLADRNGRVIAFQARKLRDDDPLRGKYVNSPESDLFHKSQVLYGLNLARRAIAKEERAIVVEGNADVIALRQSGLEPVVASMGTALTEHQLRELGRLTRRVYLCFDADAAGEEATLRGMDLAAGQGLEVKVVPLPAGRDPADAVDEFGALLGRAESYLVYRVRLEIERASDRQEAFMRVRERLSKFEDSPERQD